MAKDLPEYEGYHWRVIDLGDLDALAHFHQICSDVDGSIQTSSYLTWKDRLSQQTNVEFNSIIAINAERNILAVGWIDYSQELKEVRAFLDGCVHPDYRNQGIGKSLIIWLEARAIEHLQEIANGRKTVLRIMFYDRPPDAIKLFEASGFTFMYAEIEMAYNLAGQLPDYSLSPDIRFESWSFENSKEYYSIYKDAFQTRTKNIMEEAAWIYHFANDEDEDFRPDLSLLMRIGDQAVAYTVCHVEKDRNGELRLEPWITQMGVRQTFRRRGLASQLLGENLHRMKNAGYSKAKLSVNTNNHGANKLYKQVGFETLKTFTMYAKTIST